MQVQDNCGADAFRVLIVEDEAITALHLESLVSQLGYEVCSVEATGEGAIAAAAAHKPDLVLMDVRLAGELDGIAAAMRIRREFGIPSLLVTAYTDPGTRERAKTCDSIGMLSKPYTARQVERMLAEATSALGNGMGGACA